MSHLKIFWITLDYFEYIFEQLLYFQATIYGIQNYQVDLLRNMFCMVTNLQMDKFLKPHKKDVFLKKPYYAWTTRSHGNIHWRQQLWNHLWPLLLTWFNFNPSMDK